MYLFKKHKTTILILVGLVILYFATRLLSILSLPIFTDEAIYIRWAQIAGQDANWRFISLTDGKQPMPIWLMAIFLRFIEDPLLAGRLVSVGAGFFTMTGLYFLGREIFKNNTIGLISAALYVIFPMSLVYDRMALYDSMVGAFAIWSLFFIVLLARTIRLDLALILGMIIGGGVLTKTNAFFSIYLLPLSMILLDWRGHGRVKRFGKWLVLAFVSIVLAYSFYSVLRLSPFFHIISEKNAIFVFPFSEWVTHPFAFFESNWRALWDWITRYLGWSLMVLSVLSFFVSKKYVKEKIILFLWFLVPFLALALFGKTLYPRFILFMLLFLLPLGAFSIYFISLRIRKKIFIAFFWFLLLGLSLRMDYFILKDFSKSKIPKSDIDQYHADWPSGGGIHETIEFFKKEAEESKIYIATQGTFGLMPFAYEIYLSNNTNIQIEGYWPTGGVIPEKIVEISKETPLYFVFYQPCSDCRYPGDPPMSWKGHLELISKYERGHSSTFLSVYKVKQ
jgi:4-amino-4-deoxy-L-arabinose transferase-like glycosyltransferase